MEATSAECVICFDRLAERPTAWLPCAHCYHVDCIDAWLLVKMQCPTCNLELGRQQDEPPPPQPHPIVVVEDEVNEDEVDEAPVELAAGNVVNAFQRLVQKLAPPAPPVVAAPAAPAPKRRRVAAVALCPYCNKPGHKSAENCAEMAPLLKEARERAAFVLHIFD